MAVKLRLKRMGAKRIPFYRIVAADSRSPRDGRFIEIVGTYNPVAKADQVTLKEELVMKWLSNGAQPTDTVRDILSKAGIMQKFHESKPNKEVKAEKPAKETKMKKVAKPVKAEEEVKATKEEKSAKTEKATKEAKKADKAEEKPAKKQAAKKTETKEVKKTKAKAKTTIKKTEKAKAVDKPMKAKKETKTVVK